MQISRTAFLQYDRRGYTEIPLVQKHEISALLIDLKHMFNLL